MMCLQLGPPGFNCWIYLTLVFIVYIVDSLSLYCLLFISRFVCTRYINMLGIFHAKKISICLDYIRNKGEVGTIKHI